MNAFQSILLGFYYFIGVEGMVLFRLLTCQFKWFKKWDERFKQNTMLLLEERQVKTQMKRERASYRRTQTAHRSKTAGCIHGLVFLLSCGGKLSFYNSMLDEEQRRRVQRSAAQGQCSNSFSYYDHEDNSDDDPHFGGYTKADQPVAVPPPTAFFEAEQTFGTEEKTIHGDDQTSHSEIYKPFL
eukprot:CAMPEP_0117448584 /NCGR_PEP_ID=MMETSP0759-20121206/7481_1 /TAXON_ID=63605 /ORGANISM="Percolomonas cosmopolitus, Strain WS" /LENGTH=183 /DNA_ID=CAMNT_0005240985 /DNA_START=894 /DNA_END=1445 /DNA_ORIENTATION=+